MKRQILFSAFAAIAMSTVLGVAGAAPSDEKKTIICHYDADTNSYFDLIVGLKAANAHLTQHEYDYAGVCDVC